MVSLKWHNGSDNETSVMVYVYKDTMVASMPDWIDVLDFSRNIDIFRAWASWYGKLITNEWSAYLCKV